MHTLQIDIVRTNVSLKWIFEYQILCLNIGILTLRIFQYSFNLMSTLLTRPRVNKETEHDRSVQGE